MIVPYILTCVLLFVFLHMWFFNLLHFVLIVWCWVDIVIVWCWVNVSLQFTYLHILTYTVVLFFFSFFKADTRSQLVPEGVM